VCQRVFAEYRLTAPEKSKDATSRVSAFASDMVINYKPQPPPPLHEPIAARQCAAAHRRFRRVENVLRKPWSVHRSTASTPITSAILLPTCRFGSDQPLKQVLRRRIEKSARRRSWDARAAPLRLAAGMPAHDKPREINGMLLLIGFSYVFGYECQHLPDDARSRAVLKA
jgi:hypothetical protein